MLKQGQLVKPRKAKFVSNELYQKWMKSEVMKVDILMTSEAWLGETYFIAEKRNWILLQAKDYFVIRANPNIIPSHLDFCFTFLTYQRCVSG